MDLLTLLRTVRVVPVVEIPEASVAVDLARTLVTSGLRCAEITFRTEAAASAIASIVEHVPGISVAAGTVLSVDQARAAQAAGASFLVAPGLNEAVVAFALANGLSIVPGVATPSEVERAMTFGLSLLKLFPAEPLGGVEYLRALAGPYKEVQFVPTGGINVDNLASYLRMPNVAACGGSWMVRSELLAKRDFSKVAELTEQAVSVARSLGG